MSYKTFAEYWEATYIPSNMPEVFDMAMRELAEKSWNAAIASIQGD